MNPELWQQVKAVFDHARRLPAGDRSSFLMRRCDGDSRLEREVRDLLQAEPGDEFLDTPHLPAAEPAGLASTTQHGEPLGRLGDCELTEELGRGGMGRVYRARELTLGRDVAVKVMSGLAALDPRAGARFELEASAAARLDHPSIVRIHRVDRTDDDEPYIVMELLPGHDLRREIECQRTLRDGADAAAAQTLPTHGTGEYMAAVARLCLQLAEALTLAHEKRLLHRDVKPDNIMLRPDGRPCLVDFGLARDHATEGHTLTGEIRGTPAYMSPEQILGLPDIDGRTDVYSMGAVLYELLTLQCAFVPGRAREELQARVLEGPPAPPRKLSRQVPRDLDTICQRALQTRREDRYATMADLRDDLAAFLEHRAIAARPLSMAERFALHVRRRRRSWVAAVCMAVSIMAAVLVTHLRETERQRDELARVWRPWVNGGLDQARPADVRAIAEALSQAAVEHPELAESPEALGMLAQVRQYGERLHTTGLQLIEEGLGHDEQRPTSLDRVFDGLLDVGDAAALLPGNDEVGRHAQLAEWFPRVRFELHLPADVDLADVRGWVRPMDMVKGQAQAATPLPEGWRDDAIRLAPGQYRFVFTVPGVGHAELTRFLSQWSRTEDVDVWLRRDEGAGRAGMVLVPGGSAIVGLEDDRFPWNSRRAIEIEPFWIDTHEVTNADYLEFVQATGARRPTLWGDGSYDSSIDDLPVVGITQLEARAYAEWCGKRLPTWSEWDAAARGQSDGDRPVALQGLDPSQLRDRCMVEHNQPGDDPREDPLFPGYYSHMTPVGSHPSDVSPYGVLDMLGSVMEWTESPYLTVVNGLPEAQTGSRIVKGNSWLGPAYLSWVQPAHYIILSQSAGIRCVRSANGGP